MKIHLTIASGGQTGVDRAALDAALGLKIPCQGWCPQGRKAEDGVIEKKYPLRETPTDQYEERTEWNVRDSDATLILTWGMPQGGTLHTHKVAQKLRKPFWVVNFEEADLEKTTVSLQKWFREKKIKVLNIAGPRASFGEHIYSEAYDFLVTLLKKL